MKASENRHGHRKLKYCKELNSGEGTEEANKFACGIQDIKKLHGLERRAVVYSLWTRDYRFCWD